MRRAHVAAALLGLTGLTTALLATPAAADPPPDTTAPKITVDIAPSPWQGWYPGPVTVTLSASDARGVETLHYRLTGAQTGEETSDTGSAQLTIQAQGVTEIFVSASDPAGNVAQLRYGVGVDLTDPTITRGGTITNGAVLHRDDVATLTYTCADAPTGIAGCSDSLGVTSGGNVPTSTTGKHTVVITATDRVGRSSEHSLTYTVVPRPLVVLTRPQVTGYTGSPRPGDVLVASSATFQPGADSITYEWWVGGFIVSTAATYPVTAADVGKGIYVRAVGKRDGYADTTTAGSDHVVVEKVPYVLGTPVVTGSAREGSVLTVQSPAVTPAPTSISTRWTIGSQIVVTDQPGLRLTGAHVGKRVSCEVTYASATHVGTAPCRINGGTTTAAVTGLAWTIDRRAAVRGTARTGRVLTAVPPRLSGKADRFTYRWLRDGKVIKGATGARFKVRKADRRHRISVKVTAHTAHRPGTVSTSLRVRIR